MVASPYDSNKQHYCEWQRWHCCLDPGFSNPELVMTASRWVVNFQNNQACRFLCSAIYDYSGKKTKLKAAETQCLNSVVKVIFRHVHNITKSDHKLCYVRPSTWHNSAPIGWILKKFNIWQFSENLSWKFKFD